MKTPREKQGMSIFTLIEKIVKQSLKTLCSSLGYGILNADYPGLRLFFSLYLLFILNFIILSKEQRQ